MKELFLYLSKNGDAKLKRSNISFDRPAKVNGT